MRTRPQTDAHYATLIRDFLERGSSASREDVDGLIIPLLSEALTTKQKQTKISNLLTKLRREGSIQNVGSRTQPRWELV